MQSDPLQQLKDIHLPADPSWWPPAPGWWLLALLLTALLIWGIRKVYQAWQSGAPIRIARKLHAANTQAVQAGQLSAQEYAHQSNELLKRLLVRALGRTDLAQPAAQDWLEALDEISGSDSFTNGPGQALGPSRFQAHIEVDAEALDSAIQGLLQKVRPGTPSPRASA
ncbi:MAG: DUF4381 domain-containing protein [Pseudomonadota bacterium]